MILMLVNFKISAITRRNKVTFSVLRRAKRPHPRKNRAPQLLRGLVLLREPTRQLNFLTMKKMTMTKMMMAGAFRKITSQIQMI